MSSLTLSSTGNKLILLLGLIFLFSLSEYSCVSRKTVSAPADTSQGISGKLIFKEGNFSSTEELPEEGKIFGIEREIYIYPLTSLKESELAEGDFFKTISTTPLDTILTQQDGTFKLPLEVGKYSLVINEGGRLYSKISPDYYLFPVKVEKNKLTNVVFEVDYMAHYSE